MRHSSSQNPSGDCNAFRLSGLQRGGVVDGHQAWITGRRGKLPSLAKEGWPRQSNKWSRSFKGADGHERSECEPDRVKQGRIVRSTSDNWWAEPTTPSAPAKEASQHFLSGRSHPSFPRRGVGLSRSSSPTPEPLTPPVHALTLRRFRPPFEATVQLRNTVPIGIAFHGVHGTIEKTSGPWRSSGDWWRPNTWDREEWDIQVLEAVYRIYYDVHTDRWFAEGVYD